MMTFFAHAGSEGFDQTIDDPENFVSTEEPCFGLHGLTTAPVADSEKSFIQFVQPLIIAKIQESLS